MYGSVYMLGPGGFLYGRILDFCLNGRGDCGGMRGDYGGFLIYGRREASHSLGNVIFDMERRMGEEVKLGDVSKAM